MSIQPHIREYIESVAEDAYHHVASSLGGGVSPDEVYRMPQCRNVTGFISGIMREAGLEVEVISRGGVVDEHRYLKFGEHIIDATWQQFISRSGSDDLPRVYVGLREGLQDLADLNGALPEVARLWDQDGPGRILTVQERIAQHYDHTLVANA